jgi:hypothetical protein
VNENDYHSCLVKSTTLHCPSGRRGLPLSY